MNLLEAVHRVDVPRVAVLLSQGADVNVTDSQGVTPLIIACERGELRMVDLLLEANASTKLVTNDTQSSCLHIAAKSNAADIVQRLLTVDRSLEEKTNCQGDTALMLACLGAEEKTKSTDTLKALLQPLDSTPTNSNTANKLTVEPSTTTTRNGTPGRGKTSKRSLSVPATSTSNGSNTSEGEGVPYLGPDDPRLRVRNRHGHTVLHIATFTHSPTAVRMLLEAGADCTVVDKTGRTAMQAALNIVRKGGGQREGFDTCLKLLQQRRIVLSGGSGKARRPILPTASVLLSAVVSVVSRVVSASVGMGTVRNNGERESGRRGENEVRERYRLG